MNLGNIIMKIAVIGTRDESQLELAKENLFKFLDDNNVTLVRSGNAYGSDQLANLFNGFVEHYLPWKSYNEELRYSDVTYILGDVDIFDDKITELFPWVNNKNGLKKLVRRNCAIILGINGDDPVDAVLWHNPKGVTGGTAYGVKLAEHLGISTIRI